MVNQNNKRIFITLDSETISKLEELSLISDSSKSEVIKNLINDSTIVKETIIIKK